MAALLSSPPVPRLRFGLFELNPETEELCKAGVRLRIQGQPLRILLYLAQRPGEIVTREQLHRAFWKPDTTIDLDRSLAAAIHKIRECLGDSVTNPRFVETVSRSGYRFIAPVAAIQPEGAPPEPPSPPAASRAIPRPIHPTVAEAPSATIVAARSIPFVSARARSMLLVLAGLFLVSATVALLPVARTDWPFAPAIRPITRNASVALPDSTAQGFVGAVADNARIYFSRSENGRGELAVVMLNGGDTTPIDLPEELGSPVADDVSPDGLRLLLRDRLSMASEQALWVASPAGKTARQVPGVLAHDSAWMPDGDTILYANGNALYTVRDNGAAKVQFASLPGRPFRMRWSPDGSRLRLTLRDDRTLATSLWELRSDGSHAHQLLAGWHPDEPICCGVFLSTGDLYIFQAGDERSGSLWAVPVHTDWLGRQRAPFRLADGPLFYTTPAARRGDRSIVFAGMAPTFRLLRSSLSDNRLAPAPDFLTDAERVQPSADGHWVSWVRRDDGSLWRSRSDGTDRVRVLGAPYQVSTMAWSPDGTRLAIMARRPGSPWRILLAEVNSGHSEELLHDDPHNQADPQWTADGAEIVFGRLPPRLAEPNLPASLFQASVATRKVIELPGSAGLYSPRISPDGRTLIAVDASQTTLRQLDLTTSAWATIAKGHFEDPVFQPGGRTVVFHDFTAPGLALRRLELATRQITSLPEPDRDEARLGQARFAGLFADGAPAVSVAPNDADLYELTLPE